MNGSETMKTSPVIAGCFLLGVTIGYAQKAQAVVDIEVIKSTEADAILRITGNKPILIGQRGDDEVLFLLEGSQLSDYGAIKDLVRTELADCDPSDNTSCCVSENPERSEVWLYSDDMATDSQGNSLKGWIRTGFACPVRIEGEGNTTPRALPEPLATLIKQQGKLDHPLVAAPTSAGSYRYLSLSQAREGAEPPPTPGPSAAPEPLAAGEPAATSLSSSCPTTISGVCNDAQAQNDHVCRRISSTTKRWYDYVYCTGGWGWVNTYQACDCM
jgi:hypothetical protein